MTKRITELDWAARIRAKQGAHHVEVDHNGYKKGEARTAEYDTDGNLIEQTSD